MVFSLINIVSLGDWLRTVTNVTAEMSQSAADWTKEVVKNGSQVTAAATDWTKEVVKNGTKVNQPVDSLLRSTVSKVTADLERLTKPIFASLDEENERFIRGKKLSNEPQQYDDGTLRWLLHKFQHTYVHMCILSAYFHDIHKISFLLI
jgi:hypothetical protein